MSQQHKRKLSLSRLDGWVSAAQLAWDKAYAFLISGTGAVMMGYLASITSWFAKLGPLGWGLVALATFVVIYGLLVWGRRSLAAARKDRAEAAFNEQLGDASAINPLAPHFHNQRIRLTDLHTPFGDGLTARTFVGCDLIGPAVLLLSQFTIYRRNTARNVEYLRVDANSIQLWPNKVTLFGGLIEDCRLFNVIIMVPEQYSKEFESSFTDSVPWANDPPLAAPTSVGPALPPPQGTGAGTQP